MDPLDESLKFFDEHAPIQKHGFKLPHWQQPGACYFVTFRLADSIPQDKLERWKEEREAWIIQHPKPWDTETEAEYHRRFSGQIEKWLDQSYGECVLRDPEIAGEVEKVLMFHDLGRYVQHSWVVMPNHVHAMFSLHPDEEIDSVLKSWKGVSARRVNARLDRAGTKLWQTNYFDRLIRDGSHFRNVACYIRRNPERARLRAGEYRLYESRLVKALVG